MTEKLSIEKRFSDIEHNLEVIRSKIDFAAKKSGRKAEDITFMAVTKTVEPVFINKAIECGVDLIGENKVQEFLSKKEYLKLDSCTAHLIGHLQTNKVKQIVGQVDMIQSLDSLKLAKEISKQSTARNIVTKCLVEVNVGQEDSKTGIDFLSVGSLLDEISQMQGIKVCGLMAIPPICENESELSAYFEKMHRLFIDTREEKRDNIDMQILSMGMSGDYEKAIECGSNLVRVGSAVFGPRIY